MRFFNYRFGRYIFISSSWFHRLDFLYYFAFLSLLYIGCSLFTLTFSLSNSKITPVGFADFGLNVFYFDGKSSIKPRITLTDEILWN